MLKILVFYGSDKKKINLRLIEAECKPFKLKYFQQINENVKIVYCLIKNKSLVSVWK